MENFNSFPFDTSKNPINITQGFNGPRSHKSFIPKKPLDLSYAVDFALSIYTEIYSVKRGIVKATCDWFDIFYEGTDPNIGMKYGRSINYISIGDLKSKKETIYIHLAKDSICVKVGQIIDEGTLIGYTGKSGWIGPNPHLHFQHSHFIPFKGTVTIPFKFKGYDKSLEHSDIK